MDQRNFLSPTELLGDKFQIEIARHNDLIMICQIIPPANFSKEPVIEISAAHNRIARIALNNGLKIAGSITLNAADIGGGNTLDIVLGIAPTELDINGVKEMKPVENATYPIANTENVASQLLPRHGWGEKFHINDARSIHSFARQAIDMLGQDIYISANTVIDGAGIQVMATRTKL